GAAPAADGLPTEDERNMAVLAHASGILTWFVGPLVIWQMKKGQSAYIEDQAKEARNFQLTLLIGDVIAILIMAIAPNPGLGMSPWLPVLAARVGLGIMGVMAASAGKPFKYVVNARFIK